MGPNYPFAWKRDFLWKLTNATHVYLLFPIMLQSRKNVYSVGEIMRYKVLQFWTKLDTNYRLTLKGDFLKKLMLILSTWCTLWKYYNVQKKITKMSQDTRLHHFLTNWRTVYFGRKLTVFTFVNLLCTIILKSLD